MRALVWIWRNLFRKKQVERDLDEELRSYFDGLADNKMRAGLDLQAARRAALIEMGGIEQVKEEVRTVRLGSFFETLSQDVRFGARSLIRHKGFTTVAILTLAIAIGANTAIFSFVDGVLLKPLPYPSPEELVMVWEKPPGAERNGVSALNFLDWKAQNTVFEHIAAMTGYGFTWSGSGEPQQLGATTTSASYFNLVGARFALGRGFAPDEDQVGKHQVVVLTNRIWQSRFGGDPNVLGRVITLDGRPYTIIGVLEGGGLYDRGFSDIWTPLAFTPDRLTRDFHWLRVFARMKPGVTIERARAEMSAIAGRIAQEYPHIKKGWGATVDRFVDRVVGDQLRRSLYVLFAAVAAILLIGCANLANLTLARNAARTREVAIRSAMGAGRGRLIRQMLTESLLVSSIGAVAGIGVGFGLMRAIQFWMPPFMLPVQAEVVLLDWRVMAFTAAVAILTGILFGVAPAIDSAKRDTTGALRDGGRGSTAGMSRHRVRNVLIVAEVAIAFVLLSGAGLLIRSFVRLLNVDAGFETTNVVTMGLPRIMGRDTDGPRLSGYYRTIIESIASVPGVRDVALSSGLPLQGWGFGMPFHIAGQPAGDRSSRRGCGFKIVTPSYFRAIGMRLKRGRALNERDVAGSTPVAVINETMARRFFEKDDPIGKRILIEQIITGKTALGPDVPWEIVGVVADEKVNGLDAESAGVYVPLDQSPIVGVALVVRAAADPSSIVKAVQSAVWSINKEQALSNVRTLEQIKSQSVAPNRLRTFLIAVFAGIALALAVIGVYGVMSYSVAQRTHEMGIRSALGASSGNLIRLVVGNGLVVAVIGLLLGGLGAWWLTRFLQTLMFNTSVTDAATMITVACVLLGAATLACVVPARRATRIDPLEALRAD